MGRADPTLTGLGVDEVCRPHFGGDAPASRIDRGELRGEGECRCGHGQEASRSPSGSPPSPPSPAPVAVGAGGGTPEPLRRRNPPTPGFRKARRTNRGPAPPARGGGPTTWGAPTPTISTPTAPPPPPG